MRSGSRSVGHSFRAPQRSTIHNSIGRSLEQRIVVGICRYFQKRGLSQSLSAHSESREMIVFCHMLPLQAKPPFLILGRAN